jgi:putative Holliday junction resolvase
MLVCLDVGSRWVGVAKTDETETIAVPVATFDRRRPRTRVDLCDLLTRISPRLLIVGVPTSPDGGANRQARPIRRFANRLASQSGLDVQFVDESHTTAVASEYLSENSSNHRIDAIAAALILESHLSQASSESRR